MNTLTEPPSLSLAVRPPHVGSCRGAFQAASRSGIDQIDLEYRFRWTRIPRIVAAAQQTGVAIRALWVPPAVGARLAASPTPSLVRPIADLVDATSAGALVIDRSGSDGRHDRHVGCLVAAVRQHVPIAVRLAFALRPASLEGTREHLNVLTALRRQCEEWDLDLALDLDGPIDPTWESEAALTRVLPRLSVVRLGPSQSRPPGRGRERQTARVIAHLADAGYPGIIAISANLPFWRPDGAFTLGRAFAETRAKVFSRYGSIPAETPIDSPIWSQEHR